MATALLLAVVAALAVAAALCRPGPALAVVVSTIAYTIATLATGNFMLGFAAILLGAVVAAVALAVTACGGSDPTSTRIRPTAASSSRC